MQGHREAGQIRRGSTVTRTIRVGGGAETIDDACLQATRRVKGKPRRSRVINIVLAIIAQIILLTSDLLYNYWLDK